MKYIAPIILFLTLGLTVFSFQSPIKPKAIDLERVSIENEVADREVQYVLYDSALLWQSNSFKKGLALGFLVCANLFLLGISVNGFVRRT